MSLTFTLVPLYGVGRTVTNYDKNSLKVILLRSPTVCKKDHED